MICGRWPNLLLTVALTAFCGCRSFPPSTFPEDFSQPPSDVTLLPGDEVEILFLDASDLNTTQIIRRDGKITLKLIGEVQAAGKTPLELRKELLGQYKSQLQINEISVQLKSFRFLRTICG